MKEFIEKLIERLEEESDYEPIDYDCCDISCTDEQHFIATDKAIEIVNQLAEEYNNKSVKGDLISRSAVIKLIENKCVDGCLEQDDITLIDAYGLMDDVSDLPTAYNNGWIPCSERLPEDCDNRFYMCIVENHEEDLPMFCQYDENYGFGFWQDIYDEHTFGFVDSEFKTNEELGYEKVIAWKKIAPYQPKGE